MIINGAGGCYENRFYEMNIKDAWNITLQTLNDMGVQVDEWDENVYLVKFHNVKKQMQIVLHQIDAETIELAMDSRGKHLLVYCWHKENKEVEMFFNFFESRLHEFRAFVICPTCGREISAFASVCPDCGQKILTHSVS